MTRILVRRMGALGDVILTTPVLRRLREENPDAEIVMQTMYGNVFLNSPHRIMTMGPGQLPYPWTKAGGVTREIDLDGAYEKQPHMHISVAYMQEAFGDFDHGDLQPELFFGPGVPWAKKRRTVAVHAAKAGWRNRTLPEATWLRVVELLKEADCFPILVGTQRDTLAKAKCATFHSADLQAQTALISRCACFIGSDSALVHAAGCTDVPIVGIYTCALPETRLPWRHGVYGWQCGWVQPALDCVGCLARQPAPASLETCERGDVACVGMVQAKTIVETALRVMKEAEG